MKNRDIYWRRYKIQETLYTGQYATIPFKVGTLGPHTVLPITISYPAIFFWISWMSELSSLSKVILVLGKTRSCRVSNLYCSGGWVTRVIWCFTKNSAWDVMHEREHRYDEAANHQLPIAVAFWIIWIVSAEECLSLMQTLMQICCSTHSVILNVTATQYTCSLNVIYNPHWLVQWNHHCSHMCIPVHSPWLPGYFDVTQTVLIILTMAGLFPDRPHMRLFSPVLWNILRRQESGF